MDQKVTSQNPWLHRYAVLVSGATLILVTAGASVTSTGSGLAVPDWPLSFGTLFPPMVGGVLYEHGHRMIAGVVVLLTTILVVWLSRREERVWVRKIGYAALGALIVQALLGGLTVLLRLPPLVSVSHSAFAMLFLCMTVSIALFTSGSWRQAGRATDEPGAASLHRLALATTAVIYVQILLGAVMRHTGAGLAIPDFPLSYGRLVPPVFSQPVLIHFTHRVGAVAVSLCVIWLFVRTLRHHRHQSQLLHPSLLLAGILILQVFLGGLTIWTRRAVIPTTAHVSFGAVLLVLSLIITLRSYRLAALSKELRHGARGSRSESLGVKRPTRRRVTGGLVESLPEGGGEL